MTKEYLLKEIGGDAQYQIFQKYFVWGSIQFKKKYINPFRNNKTPNSCFWYSSSNILYFRDFGDEQYGYMTCFDFVMRLYGINFVQTLHKIAKDFNIQEDLTEVYNLSANYNSIAKEFKAQPLDKKSASIQQDEAKKFDVYFRNYNEQDKQYWKDCFCISLPTLKLFNVHAVKAYSVVSGKSSLKYYDYEIARDVCYCYLFKNNKVKLYRPYSVDRKWRTNLGAEDVFGLEQLPKTGELLIITSSLKDIMCLYELGFSSIAFQSEHISPTEELMTELKSRFDRIVFLYDLDVPGMKSSIKFAIQHKVEVRFLRKLKTNVRCKDIANFMQYKGFDYTYQLIKQILE